VRYYTGVGSRNTPDSICCLISKLALFMENKGFILRSGCAAGADTAFYKGLKDKSKCEIYLPWKGFNGSDSLFIDPSVRALKIAERTLDNSHWNTLTSAGRKLHARNVHQVLGPNCDSPSELLVCWTKDGRDIGGTATAIKVARNHNIRVYNLGKEATRAYFENLINLPWE